MSNLGQIAQGQHGSHRRDRSTMSVVRLRQGPLQYYEQGSGEPLVFVHGLLVNGYLWRQVVPPLARRYRCIVPDWPLGSHHLPLQPEAEVRPPDLARMIVELMDRLQLDTATLVGNDTGGALCQLVVSASPQRVTRLVLTNCDAYENFLPPTFRPLQWAGRVPGLTFVVAQAMRFDWMRRLPIAYGKLTQRPLPAAALDEYLGSVISNPAIRRDVRKVLGGIAPSYTLGAAATFGSYARPVLLAWGRDDRVFPPAYAERLRQAFPQARLDYIANAAAFVPEDQPQRLAASIAAFIATSQ
jgi:pimeloyl-ACP methyl ester carboxylesterase